MRSVAGTETQIVGFINTQPALKNPLNVVFTECKTCGDQSRKGRASALSSALEEARTISEGWAHRQLKSSELPGRTLAEKIRVATLTMLILHTNKRSVEADD